MVETTSVSVFMEFRGKRGGYSSKDINHVAS